ncbi:MAG: pyridoxal phosphate-dependent aminotransferase [Bryobacteraceae bacterium]|nr:pyridoxal phosphate-dependent aminotransferase [Bryobacteraceae bacterium]
MKHSRRFSGESRPNALSLARATSGRPLLDLTVSNPTQAGIPYPEDLLAALADPRALRYQPSAMGLQPAREAVAAYYASLGAEVHPDQILLTASTSEAYHYLFKLLADPGDEVLIPRPSYPLFEFLAGLELLETVPYPLHAPDPWNLASTRTRALIAVHPNNPTGDFLIRPDRLAERCAALGIALIADEVFLDYPLTPAQPPTLAALDAFVLSGLSKICGLPQMKLGWLVMPRSLPAAMRERLELIADTYLSVSAPVQWAAVSWLARRVELQAPILARLRRNSAYLVEAFADSGMVYQPPQAGWTAVLKLPSTTDEEVLALRLIQVYGVLLQPGYFYDFSGDPRVVLSLLTPPEDLAAGVNALKDALSH